MQSKKNDVHKMDSVRSQQLPERTIRKRAGTRAVVRQSGKSKAAVCEDGDEEESCAFANHARAKRLKKSSFSSVQAWPIMRSSIRRKLERRTCRTRHRILFTILIFVVLFFITPWPSRDPGLGSHQISVFVERRAHEHAHIAPCMNGFVSALLFKCVDGSLPALEKRVGVGLTARSGTCKQIEVHTNARTKANLVRQVR